MAEKINVCLACDDNYSKYAGVVIASTLANANSDDDLVFYILDGGISETRKSEILSLKSIKSCDINFINIDAFLFEDYKNVKSHKYITLATYYRLKLPSLLPDVSRVIYLDCDMVVTTSLSELFNKKLEEKPLAGVSDIKKKRVKINPTYVNAGMLIMDLDNMRKQNIEEKFLEWTKKHIDTIKTGDQEIINEVCKGNILVVEDEWNVQSSNFTNRSSYTNNPKIVHFTATLKPWHYASFSYHRNLYFKYLQMTPWKLSPEELKHWTKDNQIASLIAYFKYRPLFWLRPRFYYAVYKTYINFSAIKRSNKILIHKTNGKIQVCKSYPGLSIKFKGTNNIVEIWEPCRFRKYIAGNRRSKLDINGSNNKITIKPTVYIYNSIRVIGIGNNCQLNIGRDMFQTGSLWIDYADIDDINVSIGDNCMFGYKVNLMCGDHHTIYSMSTGEVLNYPKKGITIGNHVWLAKNTIVLKEVDLPDNSVVAAGTTVSKSFVQPNIIIGGSPNRILKEHINWALENVNNFDKNVKEAVNEIV